ncbi:hypothetical protein GCM10022419_114730 [Nonomuraea rosea]|uniref:Uncharacterized protein n=1 Tax=Nonomuraea rosea TaxID=638574 RepID=A0ABP6ZP27_9ACTN
MAHLNITNLHCVKTRDGFGGGGDELDIFLKIDGGAERHVSGPHRLDKSRNDENVTLNIHEPFRTEVLVRLRERNGALGGANDLDLGIQDIGPALQSARDLSFSGNNGRVVYTARIGVSA